MAYTNRWRVRFEAEKKEIGRVKAEDIWISLEVSAITASEAIDKAIDVLGTFGNPLYDMVVLTLLERMEE